MHLIIHLVILIPPVIMSTGRVITTAQFSTYGDRLTCSLMLCVPMEREIAI